MVDTPFINDMGIDSMLHKLGYFLHKNGSGLAKKDEENLLKVVAYIGFPAMLLLASGVYRITTDSKIPFVTFLDNIHYAYATASLGLVLLVIEMILVFTIFKKKRTPDKVSPAET